MYNLGGIDYFERRGSKDETSDGATRVIVCNWSERFSLINSFLGFGFFDAAQIYPHNALLRCTSVSNIRGIGKHSADGGGITYNKAEITLVYGFQPAEEGSEEDTIASMETSYSSEEHTINISADVNDRPILRPRKIRLPITVYTYTRKKVEVISQSAFNEAIGKINSGAFEGAAARTLRFDGVRTQRHYTAIHQESTSEGGQEYHVVYTFSKRNPEWNKVIDEAASADTGEITFVDGKPKEYEETSFEGILTW